MKFFLTLYLSFVASFGIFAQEQLLFSTFKKKINIPFKLVNNLIIIPLYVNGTQLNFLLDSGVEETILFSLDEKKELPLYNVEKILLKGLGTQDAIEGLKSYKNQISVPGLEFVNQEIVIVLDQDFNFSSSLGIEVNGIIGFHFFSQNVVQIDYAKKKISIYNPEGFDEKKVLSKFKKYSFSLENAKPYITIQVELNKSLLDTKCLIDTGNSDGLWLFETKNKNIVVPEPNFDDFLGRGFSGEIYGKKAKITSASLGEYKFFDVITAFPDAVSLTNVKMVKNRMGSIGGEFLRRFKVVFDYRKEELYVKKNSYFRDKFKYNASGLIIHHVGLQWYKEELRIDGLLVGKEEGDSFNGNLTDIKYNFKLIPIYEILNVRKNSPAEKVGLLSGDVVVKINGTPVYKLTLDHVNELMKAQGEKEVTLIVDRKGKQLSFTFKIIDLL